MRRGITIAVAMFLIISPVIASADQLTDLQAQLQLLRAKLAALQAGARAASSTTAHCPNLTRTLAFGARGTDVSALQQFLIAQNLLSSDSATGFDGLTPSGYFGALTQTAVQKFQASQGIVSSGTPASTGYGLVGARTRAAIAQACTHTNASANTSAPAAPKSAPASSLQPQCPLVALPTGKSCTGQWKEVKDPQGCTASWQCGG